MQARASADVFALDFDGVLVDSEPEISSSAVAAAAEYWPEQFGSLDKASLDGVREKLRIIRPVLVHGVESLIMVRCDRQVCLSSCTTANCVDGFYTVIMSQSLLYRLDWCWKSLTVLIVSCKTGNLSWQKHFKSGTSSSRIYRSFLKTSETTCFNIKR